MKALKLFTLFYCCFISRTSFAQTPKAIEADLYKSYQKIDYWASYRGKHSDSTNIEMRAEDSVEKASDAFGEKLKYYTAKYPFTIGQKFNSIGQKPSLPKDKVEILSSTDGLFRIYSWDVHSEGTMKGFENCIQYKPVQKHTLY